MARPETPSRGGVLVKIKIRFGFGLFGNNSNNNKKTSETYVLFTNERIVNIWKKTGFNNLSRQPYIVSYKTVKLDMIEKTNIIVITIIDRYRGLPVSSQLSFRREFSIRFW